MRASSSAILVVAVPDTGPTANDDTSAESATASAAGATAKLSPQATTAIDPRAASSRTRARRAGTWTSLRIDAAGEPEAETGR